MDPTTQAILAAMRAGKFGDLSSATMDPVMSYLMGTYKPAPKFDETQMWERHAPNTLLAMNGAPDDPYTVAATSIRAGTPPWALYGEVPKDVKPAAWTKFIDSIANEQQTVKSKMMEQSLEQDPFQKMGLHGAQDKYTAEDTYKYAPDAFAKIFENLDANIVKENKRKSNIAGKYGDVMITSDADKKKFLESQAIQNALGKEKQHKDAQSKRNWFSKLLNAKIQMSGAPVARAKEQAQKDFLLLKGAPIKDVAATAKNQSYANYLNSLIDRTKGSATKQMTDAQKLSTLVASQLESQGKSPLKDDLLMAVLMKNKMKNG